jgi:hypothetical protein
MTVSWESMKFRGATDRQEKIYLGATHGHQLSFILTRYTSRLAAS